MPGYKAIPASDRVEQSLRERWYKAKGAEREAIGIKLSKYLWDRTEAAVAADRLRYPNKKRNRPVGFDIAQRPGGRHLP